MQNDKKEMTNPLGLCVGPWLAVFRSEIGLDVVVDYAETYFTLIMRVQDITKDLPPVAHPIVTNHPVLRN